MFFHSLGILDEDEFFYSVIIFRYGESSKKKRKRKSLGRYSNSHNSCVFLKVCQLSVYSSVVVTVNSIRCKKVDIYWQLLLTMVIMPIGSAPSLFSAPTRTKQKKKKGPPRNKTIKWKHKNSCCLNFP